MPLIATMVPVFVSPILMVEVSTAAIRVSSCFGFTLIGWGFSWMLVGNCSAMLDSCML